MSSGLPDDPTQIIRVSGLKEEPVFVDTSGRRMRWARRGLQAAAAVAAGYTVLLLSSLLGQADRTTVLTPSQPPATVDASQTPATGPLAPPVDRAITAPVRPTPTPDGSAETKQTPPAGSTRPSPPSFPTLAPRPSTSPSGSLDQLLRRFFEDLGG